MMKNLKLLALSATAAVAASCGASGGATLSSKASSAQALQAASKPTSASVTAAQHPSQGGTVSPIDTTCPQGGKAQLTGITQSVSTTTSGVDVGQKFTLVYERCGLSSTSNGVVFFDGSLKVDQHVITALGSTTSANVEQSFLGKLQLSGGIQDSLDANILQKVSAAALSATGAQSVSLKGTLTTSSGTYMFDESVDVDGANIDVSSTAR